MPLLQLDRTHIKLLLRNLLDNAQRHGQGLLDISLRRIDGALQLTVRDHGPGIPADQLPQLCQAFFRLDADRQRSTGGVGLGLTCAAWWRRRIVGSWFWKTPGRGCAPECNCQLLCKT